MSSTPSIRPNPTRAPAQIILHHSVSCTVTSLYHRAFLQVALLKLRRRQFLHDLQRPRFVLKKLSSAREIPQPIFLVQPPDILRDPPRLLSDAASGCRPGLGNTECKFAAKVSTSELIGLTSSPAPPPSQLIPASPICPRLQQPIPSTGSGNSSRSPTSLCTRINQLLRASIPLPLA